MRVVARFPVKANLLLLGLVYSLHLGVALITIWLLKLNWTMASSLLMLIISWYLSIRQYTSITSASDDLSWSGENWLMQSEIKGTSAEYLELLASSWVTADFSLLKFDKLGQTHAWFFSRQTLGDRLYRELCYLVRLNLKESAQPS